jgi:hypothetical protein
MERAKTDYHLRPKVSECCGEGALGSNISLIGRNRLYIRCIYIVVIRVLGLMQLDAGVFKGPDVTIPKLVQQVSLKFLSDEDE